MSSIFDQTILLTLPDPKSVGSNPNQITIPILSTGKLILPTTPVDNLINTVLVVDPISSNVYFNTNIGPAAANAVTTIGPVGALPNGAAGSILGGTLTLQPADAAFPGVITTGVQSIAGAKTFTGAISASNLSGNNTGNVTLAAVGAVPAAAGASLVGQVLTLQPADAAFPGVITTGVQSIAGAKTFTDAISAPNFSGTNTGDVTLTAVGAVPAAAGASLIGQALTLQPADDTHPGVMTILAQTIAGTKTFADAISASNLSGNNTGDVTLTAVGAVPAAAGASLIGQSLTLQPADDTHPGVMTILAQTIAGAKTFTDAISASNISGANTGDVTLTAVGAVPAAAGASLIGQSLTLQPADATNPGLVTAITQTIAGAKTFADDITASGIINLPTSSSTTGYVSMEGTKVLQATGSNLFVGKSSGNFTITGNNNIVLGRGSATGITTGSTNIIIGDATGNGITAGVSNTYIGDNIANVGESFSTRIGSSLATSAYVYGILGNTPAAVTNLVTLDSVTQKLATSDLAIEQAFSNSILFATTNNDLNIVTIDAMTIRNVVQVAPFLYPITYTRIANMVFLRLPGFNVSADTGGDPTRVRLAVGIPISLRPSVFDIRNAVAVTDSSSLEQTMYTVVISVPGEVNIYAASGSNLTVNWGFGEDVLVSYMV